MKGLYKGRNKTESGESGQAIVEFAILLPVLLLLLMVPVDLYRYANTKMILKSAAGESLSRLTYPEVSSGAASASITDTITECFGEKLDAGKVEVSELNINPSITIDYPYYVYSSDRASDNPDKFHEQFETRDSSYKTMEIQIQLKYPLTPVTFWGSLFLGDTFEVVTPVYTRDIYVVGYTP